MNNRAMDWLKQAENDLLWAKDTLTSKHYAQACFICQQVAEKSLKSIALFRDFDAVKSHSVMEIAKSLGINDEMEMMAKKLDLYYISTRYPDAVPAGAPFEFFSRDQAEEAVGFAERFIGFAGRELHGK